MNNQLSPADDVTVINGAKYFMRLTQGSDAWHDLRRGMITASAMKFLVSSKSLKIADNDKVRAYIYELAAERLSDIPADNFMSYAMERGHLEEVEARNKYAQEVAPVQECGFIINDSLGFNVGLSPDGLVGSSGKIEVKSRLAKLQVQTIFENMTREPDDKDIIPNEFMLQVQTALFVTGREWCDFISYSNGFNMAIRRVRPIPLYQETIRGAAIRTEDKVNEVVNAVKEQIETNKSIYPVDWIDHHEEIIAT